MPPGINDLLQSYIATNQTTQTLILIGFALFVLWQFFRFLFGRDKQRDNTLNTVATQLSQIIGQLNTTANKREEENRAMLENIVERNAKADDRWQLVLEQNTSAQTSHTLAVKSMDERTAHLLRAVQVLDQNISTTTLNLEALQKLGEEIKADVTRVYDKLTLLFPKDEPVEDVVEQIIVEAVRDACKEKKVATDENAIVVLPIETTPETGIVAPPGGEADAA